MGGSDWNDAETEDARSVIHRKLLNVFFWPKDGALALFPSLVGGSRPCRKTQKSCASKSNSDIKRY